MNIKTKYEVGAHVWIVYEGKGEVQVYDDYIVNIVINENKEIYYFLKDLCDDVKEEDIILYEETDKLTAKVIKTMQDIRQKEEQK